MSNAFIIKHLYDPFNLLIVKGIGDLPKLWAVGE